MERSEPDYLDLDDDRPYGWCPECACNVYAARKDFGIGYDEAWGRPMVHTDYRDVCEKHECELEDERTTPDAMDDDELSDAMEDVQLALDGAPVEKREGLKAELNGLVSEWIGRGHTKAEPRFAMTWCSQCGKELGPGDSGVSHCEHHGEQK